MKHAVLILTALLAMLAYAQAEDETQVVDLRGTWKFEIGDNRQWSDPKFDDSKWDNIFVPADWENEGYPGYDGYGWYRKNFVLPKSSQGKSVYIHLIVDDVCDVYVNGTLIGEGGKFPPHYETAYNTDHHFFIPSRYLRYNQENIVAVRVFDQQLHGGIVGGRVGIFEQYSDMQFVVQFPEMWKFKTGDYLDWKNPNYDDSRWQELIVPAKWDFQGYRDYDGFAWYRVAFDVPSNLKDDEYVMLLGKIDDIDEAYLNGEMIGNTGHIRSDGSVRRTDDEYSRYRVYNLSKKTLKPGQKNILAVRVYDRFSYGGIYEGPIGIMREREYRKWESQYKNNENNYYRDNNKFQRLLDKIFNDK